jgi:hypothetical protein
VSGNVTSNKKREREENVNDMMTNERPQKRRETEDETNSKCAVVSSEDFKDSTTIELKREKSQEPHSTNSSKVSEQHKNEMTSTSTLFTHSSQPSTSSASVITTSTENIKRSTPPTKSNSISGARLQFRTKLVSALKINYSRK